MGFVNSANILCALPPFEMAIKSGRLWGSSILQTFFAPLSLLKWLSKAEGDGDSSSSLILQTSSAGAPLSLERGWG